MLIYYHKQKLIASFNKEEVRYMRIDRIKLITELAKQDLTQKHLAELSGVSRATIGNIRSGKSCTDEIGNKIAKALNVPIDRLSEK